MQPRRFVESFNAAVEGFIYVLKSERNMRIHFIAALCIGAWAAAPRRPSPRGRSSLDK
jgi:diacylglycerol kinase